MNTLSSLPDVGLLPAWNDSTANPGYRNRKWNPVPDYAINEAESGFAKLATRCAKRLHTVAPKLVWIAHGSYEVRTYWKDDDGQEHSRARIVPCYFGSIVGERPKINGWILGARMVTLATGERVTRNVPGIELPDRVRSLGPNVCEHCNTQRQRNDVFAVLNVESGEAKQVGSTCLRDFLGHDPQAILNAWQACETMDSEGSEFLSGFARSDAEVFPTLDVLELAACSIRLESWISRATEQADVGKRATASTVRALLGPMRHLTRNQKSLYDVHSVTGDVQAINDSDRTLARESLAWSRSLSGANDYEKNMLAATKHDACDPRTLGLVCSAVAGCLRHMSRLAELNLRKQTNAASVHVGSVKERLRDLPVTVEHMQFLESDWGSSTLYKFRDSSGNLLSWFASGARDSVRPGDSVLLTGTVKRHAEYKGVLETQLTRCVLTKGK